MSNVLIGIIGVILFIGLALAGALILGEDFMNASSSSRATAIISQMQQVTNAVNMHDLKTGRTLTSRTYNLSGYGGVLSPRFLKSVPRNPMSNNPYTAVDSFGSGTDTPIKFIYTDIGGGEQAREVCRAIAETAGWPSPDLALTYNWTQSTTNFPRMGCAYISDTEYDVYMAV